MVWGNHKNILPRNLFPYVEKTEDYERDLCVHGFHVYRDIYTVLGSVPPYVSTISGAVVIVRTPCFLLSLTWMSFSTAVGTS